MAVDPNALTTLEDVKQHLDIPVTNIDQDAILERMINAASQKIESFLDRRIKKRSWTEFQDGRRNDRIVLRQWPCEKPTELWNDPSSKFTDTDNQLDPADFELEGDPAIGVVLIGRRFSNGNRSIKIVYEAGYDTIPFDLSEACIMTVEFMYDMRSSRRLGTSTKNKNSETISYLGDLPDFVLKMIEPYQRFDFGHASIAVQNG